MKTILRTTILAVATLAAAGASAQSLGNDTGRGEHGGGNAAGADRTIIVSRAPGANEPDYPRLRLNGETFCQLHVRNGRDGHTFLRKCEKID